MSTRTLIPILFGLFISVDFSQLAYSEQQRGSLNHKPAAEFPSQPFTLNLQPLGIVADSGLSTSDDNVTGKTCETGIAAEKPPFEFKEPL